VLRIELSLPKLLFGNNFAELRYKDFTEVIQKLVVTLDVMGIAIEKQTLEQAPVVGIHYSKKIPLADGSAPYHYIRQIKEADVANALDTNQTDYRHEGHSYKWHCNAYEVVFYDKNKQIFFAIITSWANIKNNNDQFLYFKYRNIYFYSRKDMKKILIMINMLISIQLYADSAPIQGALYAEVRGVPGGRIRIYKGAASTYGAIKNVFSKLWKPKVYFFDKNGQVLACEELGEWRLLDRSSNSFNWNNYDKAIDTIKSRLTELPQAYQAEVWWIKALGCQSIEIRDRNQMLIARVSRFNGDYDDIIGSAGDHIPQSAINILKCYVSNPNTLYSLKISQVKNSLSIF
jgi:hypothetical protein